MGKVWVVFKEKFHGVPIRGTFMKRHKSKEEARRFQKSWNSLTSRDKIVFKKISKKRPKGFVKTKYRGIYKKK